MASEDKIVMDLDRFVEIVENCEYEVEEIYPFLYCLFDCNYNKLSDYLLGDSVGKLGVFMDTLFKYINRHDNYYGLFFETYFKTMSDDDVLRLYHKNRYFLWKVIKIIEDGRIAFIDYENEEVAECKHWFDVLDVLNHLEIFSEPNMYILDSIIYKIKDCDFFDFGEYHNLEKMNDK